MPNALDSTIPTKHGGAGIEPHARAERNTKRLRSLVIKSLQSDIKSSGRSKNSQEIAKKFITQTAGFSIHDVLHEPTVRMEKVYSIPRTSSGSGMRQKVTVEFEAYDDRPGRADSIFLVDVIVSNFANTDGSSAGASGNGDGDDASSRLVLTCTSDRSRGFQVLSVRNVSPGVRCV